MAKRDRDEEYRESERQIRASENGYRRNRYLSENPNAQYLSRQEQDEAAGNSRREYDPYDPCGGDE